MYVVPITAPEKVKLTAVSLPALIGSWFIATVYPEGVAVVLVEVSVAAAPVPFTLVKVALKVIVPSPKPLRSMPVMVCPALETVPVPVTGVPAPLLVNV